MKRSKLRERYYNLRFEIISRITDFAAQYTEENPFECGILCDFGDFSGLGSAYIPTVYYIWAKKNKEDEYDCYVSYHGDPPYEDESGTVELESLYTEDLMSIFDDIIKD